MTISDSIQVKTSKAKKMMLWFGLISITMTFAGLTSAFIVSSSRPDWLDSFVLPAWFTISTVSIALSSLFFQLAKYKLDQYIRVSLPENINIYILLNNKINEKFSIEYINISIKNGYMKKEAFDGQYKIFSKNNWAIVSSSLTTWEVLDDSKNKYRKIFDEIMGHFYPYLTKKGVDRYNKKKKEISKKIDKDFKNL